MSVNELCGEVPAEYQPLAGVRVICTPNPIEGNTITVQKQDSPGLTFEEIDVLVQREASEPHPWNSSISLCICSVPSFLTASTNVLDHRILRVTSPGHDASTGWLVDGAVAFDPETLYRSQDSPATVRISLAESQLREVAGVTIASIFQHADANAGSVKVQVTFRLEGSLVLTSFHPSLKVTVLLGKNGQVCGSSPEFSSTFLEEGMRYTNQYSQGSLSQLQLNFHFK